MVTPKRARMTGILMLAVIFTVGALTGAATMRVVDAEESPKLRLSQTERRMPNLLEQLELSPTQQAQVDGVLERRRAEMEEFWNEHGPLLRAIADSARAELRAVLTPAQLEIEERFMEERRAQSEKRDRERRESNRW
ncbi:hypothetical protein BH23GEM9_BH23GEM9_34720 [soil metagenome]